MSTTADIIRTRLETLEPTQLELIDDSAQHAGHAGNTKKGGHFTVIITSARFVGMSTLERHRAVYEAVGDLMKAEVHALAIQASTPEPPRSP